MVLGSILEPFCCRALVLLARFSVLQYLAQGPSEAWTQPTQELRSVPLRRTRWVWLVCGEKGWVRGRIASPITWGF